MHEDGDQDAREKDASGPRAARKAPRARPAAHEDADAGGREQKQPRYGRHRVALVLPSHLTVEGDDGEPEQDRRPERDRDPTRRPEQQGHRCEQRDDPPHLRHAREVVLDIPADDVFEQKPVLGELGRGRHVRVVERQLDHRAVRRPLPGEGAVRDGLDRERERGERSGT